MADTAADVKQVFADLPKTMNADAAKGMNSVIQFNLTGDGGGNYYVELKDGNASIGEGTHDAPNMTMTLSASDFVDLIRLRNISPYYVATVLRSRFAWPQVERLINGVGTPNISFGELRGLEIPVAPAEVQAKVAERWRTIRRLHRRSDYDAALASLDAAVSELEARLETGG